MAAQPQELARKIIARNADLESERAPWDGVWRELAGYFLPHLKNTFNSGSDTPSRADYDTLFDSTALQAASTLASGSLAYITPADARWFLFDAPGFGAPDKAKAWFSACSQAAQQQLAVSNFYSVIHEVFYDDAVFGTYCVFVRKGRFSPLVFTRFRVGTFSLAEDNEENVTTCYRAMEMTVEQCAIEFGEDNLSHKLKKRLEEARKTGKRAAEKVTIIHALYERDEKDREYGKQDGQNKPWASVYVEKNEKHVLRNGGFDEKPFFAGRHLRSVEGAYGVSPAWIALPDARQINFLVKQLDALAETKAFPRFLLPTSYDGEVDMRSGGYTYFDENKPNAIPRVWGTEGEYQLGLDREMRKSNAIEKAMFVDLFRMFTNETKQMTATEVAERASEKLAQFSPSFARKTTELLTPMLRAVFSILLRNGHMPPPPQEAAITNGEQAFIPPPDITFVSRVALAIKSMQNGAFGRLMGQYAPIWQLRPELMDNFRWDEINRDSARNFGVPGEWIASDDEVEAIRKSRAEAQQQAAQQQQLMSGAEAIGKVGGIKGDSMVSRLLNQSGGAGT